jgi:hypothetical protein
MKEQQGEKRTLCTPSEGELLPLRSGLDRAQEGELHEPRRAGLLADCKVSATAVRDCRRGGISFAAAS